MVLRFALAPARIGAPLLAFSGARVRLAAAHAGAVRATPHFLCATRVFTRRLSVRSFAFAPAPFDAPLLVLGAGGRVLGAFAGAFGVVQHPDSFIAERLQVLRHNLDLGDVAGHARLDAWFIHSDRTLASVELHDERQIPGVYGVRFDVIHVSVTVHVFQPDGIPPDTTAVRRKQQLN